MEALKKCDEKGCGHEQFLVWHCEQCRRAYCENHRDEHTCITQEGETETKSLEATQKDVKSEGIVSVSVKEMFEAVESRHDSNNEQLGRIHANVKSSTIQKDEKMAATLGKVEVVDKVIQESKSQKQQNIARKTKLMLLRGRSIGNDEVPNDDRIYISCLFPVNSTTLCYFFSKHTTVGDALQYIGETHTLVAFGSPVQPDTVTLCFTNIDDSTRYRWDKNSSLQEYINDDFMELGVSVILVTESIDDQKKILSEKHSACQSFTALQSSDANEISKEDYVFKKGERVTYKNSEVGIVVGVHCEEDPPYYTVQLSGEGGNVREKQTVGKNLCLFSEDTLKQVTSGTQNMGKVFGIRLSSGGKVRRIENVPVEGDVSDLKKIISLATGVLPAMQKLLYKGKVLKDDRAKLRNNSASSKTKPFAMEENSLVMLMTMSTKK